MWTCLGCLGASGGVGVNNAFLHPYSAGAEAHGRFHDFRDMLRTAKNVDEIDFAAHLVQISIRVFPQCFRDIGVDRNNLIALALQVFADAVAGPPRLVGKADHGDAFRAPQQFGDLFVVHHKVAG